MTAFIITMGMNAAAQVFLYTSGFVKPGAAQILNLTLTVSMCAWGLTLLLN